MGVAALRTAAVFHKEPEGVRTMAADPQALIRWVAGLAPTERVGHHTAQVESPVVVGFQKNQDSFLGAFAPNWGCGQVVPVLGTAQGSVVGPQCFHSSLT
jgi:hypothetical protein